MRFLVELDTLLNLQDRRVLVARKAERVSGFLVASPVPVRLGWLVDHVIRHPDAPNGTSELLITMLRVRQQLQEMAISPSDSPH